jgi:hypothetical protein
MKQIAALLAFYTFVILSVATLIWIFIFPQSRSLTNPFIDLGLYMPGQRLVRSGCQGWEYSGFNAWIKCPIDNILIQSAVQIGNYNRIHSVYFASGGGLNGGHMVAWYGEPSIAQHRRNGEWVLNWDAIAVYTRRGVNRYMASVRVIWFRNPEEGAR